MPIFEYHCDICDCCFEEVVFDDKDPLCPACGKNKTRRLMSTAVARGKKVPAKPASALSPPKRRGCGGCSGGNCSTCH